jgi:hypothetical protein
MECTLNLSYGLEKILKTGDRGIYSSTVPFAENRIVPKYVQFLP